MFYGTLPVYGGGEGFYRALLDVFSLVNSRENRKVVVFLSFYVSHDLVDMMSRVASRR